MSSALVVRQVRQPLTLPSTDSSPTLTSDEQSSAGTVYDALKRSIDVLAVTAALLLVAPIVLMIALVLAFDRQGPILFRQPRIGRYGRRFTMYKFRTMRPDRRRHQEPIQFADRRQTLKSAHDPRITRFGTFLRRTSLDELPQLLNILRGDMSLVGPRPELPTMLGYYRAEHYLRHAVTPGLTGWWQIRGRCERDAEIAPQTDLDQKLADDGYYIANRSLWLDARIVLGTISVVVQGRGAH